MPGCSYKRRRGGAQGAQSAQNKFMGFLGNIKSSASNLGQRIKRTARKATNSAQLATDNSVRSAQQGFASASHSAQNSLPTRSYGVGGKKSKRHSKFHKKRKTPRNHKKKSHRRR